MKMIARILLAVAVLSLAGGLFAQDLQSQIAFVRSQDEADRQAIVAAALNLNEKDGAAFWPMYRDYRSEMGKVGDKSWKLLLEFAEKYQAMSEEDASKMLDEVLRIEEQRNDVKTKWLGKMRKSIPATTVARFYQIDNKIDTLLRLDAAANVPLIEPKK
ncbi:MAG: hypothetical protein WC538_15650 [Thermoanaerobaculia bacterium]|jgi:hypothetical protein